MFIYFFLSSLHWIYVNQKETQYLNWLLIDLAIKLKREFKKKK